MMPEELQTLNGVGADLRPPRGGFVMPSYAHRTQAYELSTPYTTDDGWVGNDYLQPYGAVNLKYTLEALGDADLNEAATLREHQLSQQRTLTGAKWSNSDFLFAGFVGVFALALYANARANGI